MKRILLVALAVTASMSLSAKIQLPGLVNSDMVLQQQSNVNVWGKTDKDPKKAKITVKTSWDKKTYQASADSTGKWNVVVATPVAGGPYTVTISDGEAVTLDNVLVGDVWVCSGQSNMAMPMSGYKSQPIEGSLDHIIAASPKRDIRLINIGRKISDSPLDEFKGEWQTLNPKSLASFSAVGYFFGDILNKSLDIPIGLINTSWGGTRIEAWMPLDRVAKADPKYSVKGRTPQNDLAALYNGMICPIVKYGVKGFIWYQGEGNTGNARVYDKLMNEMVAQWRSDWGGGEKIPFYYVMIAPYRYNGDKNSSSGMMVVEAQSRATKLIPNSGMAATTDIGEEYCIHPAIKDKVGQRLAMQALAKTYGVKGMPCNAPTFKSANFKNDTVYLAINDGGLGLSPSPTSVIREMKGFEMAGEDKVFYPAKAVVTGKNNEGIKVWCDKVAKPASVRYAFRNFMESNVSNNYGLPLVPFRTDDWEK